MKAKFICIISILVMYSNVLQAQTSAITEDIIQAFQYDDEEAVSRLFPALMDLVYESVDYPGSYEVDTLAINEILSVLDNEIAGITYETNADKRLVADYLYGNLYSIVGDYNKAIFVYENV